MKKASCGMRRGRGGGGLGRDSDRGCRRWSPPPAHGRLSFLLIGVCGTRGASGGVGPGTQFSGPTPARGRTRRRSSTSSRKGRRRSRRRRSSSRGAVEGGSRTPTSEGHIVGLWSWVYFLVSAYPLVGACGCMCDSTRPFAACDSTRPFAALTISA